ncbi:hypothetical protein KBD87_00705 [Candidatus Saccharibacteria bacterium]|jgi:hypothetical protein|nr:hypothetical protein [Candidatus Saccharibacteria bacterium]
MTERATHKGQVGAQEESNNWTTPRVVWQGAEVPKTGYEIAKAITREHTRWVLENCIDGRDSEEGVGEQPAEQPPPSPDTQSNIVDINEWRS